MDEERTLYYVGDLFGSRRGDALVIGVVRDEAWPYDSDCAVKPFIPLQKADGINWVASRKEPEGSATFEAIHLDRPFIEVGARVRRNGMIGIVKEKKELATVKLLNDSAIIRNVSTDRLMEISEAASERQILYKGYIGEIESVTHKVRMTFPNSDACSIEYEKDNELYPGCRINPTFRELKSAKWASGSLNFTSVRIITNVSKPAKVSDIDVESLKVKWVIPLPPTPVGDHPPSVLTRNHIENVQYLPRSYMTPPPKTIRKIQITEQDLDNLHDTTEEFLNDILRPGENDNNDNGDESLEKRQKLEIEARQIGTFQPVQVLLTQNMIQIEYIEDRSVEEILSIDLDEILNRNTVEIPKREYMLKIDETNTYKFGLDKSYYMGETDQTPMNPYLNPDNTKQITWYEVNEADMTEVQEIQTEEVSVFELQSLRLNLFIENSDYVTRVTGADEFTIGTFTKILDNGKIELKDMDGNLFERWPTEISIRAANNPAEFFTKLFQVPPELNPHDFISAGHYDFAQTPKTNVSSTLFIRPDQEPKFSESFHDGIRKNLQSLINTSTPRFERTWVQTYSERPDFFTGILLGSEGSILEDLLFLVEISFPSNYPTEAPKFSLNPCSSLEQNYLPHWDELKNHAFEPWDPNATILDGLQMSREVIENVSVERMRYGEIWLPKDFFYPKIQFTDAEEAAWNERWHEVICVQSMRYVYNQIAFPEDGLYKTEVLGHYRRVLPFLMNRWRKWTVVQSTLFARQSRGFVIAVMNQLKRFETILGTSYVGNQTGNEASESESNEDFEIIHAANNEDGQNPNVEQN